MVSKVFDNEDFGFHKITVERPLRLNFQASAARIARLDGKSGFAKLATGNKEDEAQRLAEIEAGERRQQAIRDFLRDFAAEDEERLDTNREAFRAALQQFCKQRGFVLFGDLDIKDLCAGKVASRTSGRSSSSLSVSAVRPPLTSTEALEYCSARQFLTNLATWSREEPGRGTGDRHYGWIMPRLRPTRFMPDWPDAYAVPATKDARFIRCAPMTPSAILPHTGDAGRPAPRMKLVIGVTLQR